MIGDVMERLKEIPSISIDTVITSPPYWALRQYPDDKQWGAEQTFQEYLEASHIRQTLRIPIYLNSGHNHQTSKICGFMDHGISFKHLKDLRDHKLAINILSK